MFDRIAPVYDLMNRVMTAGLDRRWRGITAHAVVQPGSRVLDACCGTGDLAVACEREGGVVTGLDFSGGMLARARPKSDSVEWIEGDLLALPSRTRTSTRSPSGSAYGTLLTSRAGLMSFAGCCGRVADSRSSRSRRPAAS